jgi:hypothetical protein
VSDIQPAVTLGGSGILVKTGEGAAHFDAARKAGVTVVADLGAAADVILAKGGA